MEAFQSVRPDRDGRIFDKTDWYQRYVEDPLSALGNKNNGRKRKICDAETDQIIKNLKDAPGKKKLRSRDYQREIMERRADAGDDRAGPDDGPGSHRQEAGRHVHVHGPRRAGGACGCCGRRADDAGRADHASGDAADVANIQAFSVAWLRCEQDKDLKAFDVNFDCYFLESSLYTSNAVEKTVEALIDNQFTYEQDGALWLRTTDFGDD